MPYSACSITIVAASVPLVNNVNGPALGANDTSRQLLDDNAQLAQERLKTELKEMKEKEACRDGELAKLREDLQAATSRALILSKEVKTIRLALATAESKLEEAENAEALSRAVIDGLRQTLLREQTQHLKLKMEHGEACRVHVQHAAEMAKVGLEQSVAAEETLHREKGKLHEQLSTTNALKVALECDLAQEREIRFELHDRISRLEAEVNKLPSESRSTDTADEPVPVRPTNMEQRLASLPVEVKHSLMPLIEAGMETRFKFHGYPIYL